ACDTSQGVAPIRDRGWTARRARNARRAACEGRGEVSALVRAAAAAAMKGGPMTLTFGNSATVTRALTLEWRADGSLWAMRGDEERAVSGRRGFRWSEPAQLLSLGGAEEEEFELVRDPVALDPRSRAALGVGVGV